jgi:alpha-tubulin suppressor-like RCC1 family protein
MKTKIYFSSFILAISTIVTPVQAQMFSGGNAHSLFLCPSGQVTAAGSNFEGALGNGTLVDSNVPVTVSGLTGITDVAAGLYHSVALKNDGTVWVWGNGYSGQFGTGTAGVSNTPVQVPGITGASAIAGGAAHTVILKSDGTVFTSGYNIYGQLGNNTTTNSSTIVTVSGLTNVISVKAGRDYSMALKNDGTVWTWGRSNFGQLGNGTNTNSSIPVQVTGLNGIIEISAGGYHAMALKNDGTVWSWGHNLYGAFGVGNTTASNIPVQMTGITGSVSAIAAGGYYSMVLKSDGTVWSSGVNNVGQFGNGSTATTNINPIQASGLTNVVKIANGWQHSLALKNDGSMWVFGGGSNGQLATGTSSNSNVPIQASAVCAMSNNISEMDNALEFAIYPNPSTGDFNVALNKMILGASVKVYDVMGRIVDSINVEANQASIKLNVLSKGMYFVSVSTEEKETTQKIIIE